MQFRRNPGSYAVDILSDTVDGENSELLQVRNLKFGTCGDRCKCIAAFITKCSGVRLTADSETVQNNQYDSFLSADILSESGNIFYHDNRLLIS